MHRVLVERIDVGPGGTIAIEGDEARHALRVKRLRVGEGVELMDGRGTIAAGVVAEGAAGGGGRRGEHEPLLVRVERVKRVEPARPRVEVWSAAPKGSRIDEMVDQLSQVGAAAWRPLETARGVVDPREHKLERLNRIAAEAGKQCGRAWTMTIGAKAGLAEALRPEAGTMVVIADASGEAWNANMTSAAKAIRLLVGPEGGWTEDEVAAAKHAGTAIARFGPHVMRIETAAVAACAVIMGR